VNEATAERVDAICARPPMWFVDGGLVPSNGGGTIDSVDPTTGKVIAQVARGTDADIDAAVQSSRRAFAADTWRFGSPLNRAEMLWRLADLVLENADELALLESRESGKVLLDVARVDIPFVARYLRYWSGACARILGETMPVTMPGRWHAYTQREPVGVVGAIVPWNFPLIVSAWKIAPAVACGCTVVLKPAEETSLSGVRLAELASEAGFPPGVLNVVTGTGPEAGAALVAHPDVDKITFTGSTEVGQDILRASADTMKRTTLELGGKSAALVFDDADVPRAVRSLARQGIFFSQGQICSAASRWLVHEDIYDDVVEQLSAEAEKLVVGAPTDPETRIGPVVSMKQLDRVLGYIKVGVERDGARLAAGSTAKVPGDGYFVRPTVLADVTNDMVVAQDEIFGPVAAVIPFANDEEAVALANDSRFGLAAGVWTSDIGRAHRLVDDLVVGTVWVNAYNVTDVTTPWGGRRMSGIGREHGVAAMESYTEIKTAVVRL
jgi:aldehyde dehydrogenase (NAD+)